jgi:diguanylate cyclase (GGDEF)-like protein
MLAAPVPADEFPRLLDLAHYRILDTDPEEPYDRITRLTAHTLRLPVSVINFVDQDRQFGKSCYNTPDTTGSREHSFCAWTILTDDPFIVHDTRQDPRFHDNPLALGEGGIRFYAGVPLTTPAGHRIGSLCVTHSQPHTLTPEDLAALRDLGALVEQELQWRARTAQLTQTITDQNQSVQHLQNHLAQVQTLEAVNALLGDEFTPEEAAIKAAALIGRAIHSDWTALLAYRGDTRTYHVAHHSPDISASLLTYLDQRTRTIGPLTKAALASTQTTYTDAYHKHPDALRGAVDLGVTGVAELPLGEYGGCTYLLIALRTDRPHTAPWRAADRALIDAAGRSIRAAMLKKTQHDQALSHARLDTLTGIPNRRAFDESFQQHLDAGAPFTLAALDLDRFKLVNDQEGHARGDQVLTTFARVLTLELAPDGAVFRTGGDEFMVLVRPDLGEAALLEAVDQAVVAARTLTAVPLGASLATLPVERPGADAQALAEQVDARLYAAKRLRQDRQRSLSPVMHP